MRVEWVPTTLLNVFMGGMYGTVDDEWFWHIYSSSNNWGGAYGAAFCETRVANRYPACYNNTECYHAQARPQARDWETDEEAEEDCESESD